LCWFLHVVTSIYSIVESFWDFGNNNNTFEKHLRFDVSALGHFPNLVDVLMKPIIGSFRERELVEKKKKQKYLIFFVVFFSVGHSDGDSGRRGSRDDGRAFRQHRTCHKRRDSQAIVAPGQSTSSNGSTGGGGGGGSDGHAKTVDDQTMTPPTMVISSVTPPPTSPRAPLSPTHQHAPSSSSFVSNAAASISATANASMSSGYTTCSAVPTQHSVSCGYTPPVSVPSSPVSAVPPTQLCAGNVTHAPAVSRRDSTTQVSVQTTRYYLYESIRKTVGIIIWWYGKGDDSVYRRYRLDIVREL